MSIGIKKKKNLIFACLCGRQTRKTLKNQIPIYPSGLQQENQCFAFIEAPNFYFYGAYCKSVMHRMQN